MKLNLKKKKVKKEGNKKNQNYFIYKKMILLSLIMILLLVIFAFLYLLNNKKTNQNVYYLKQDLKSYNKRSTESDNPWKGGYIIETIKAQYSTYYKVIGSGTPCGITNFNFSKVTVNGNDATISGSYFTELNVGDNIVIIYFLNKISNTKCLFRQIDNLISVDLSNFISENIIEMDSMFYGSRELVSINFTNFKTDKVTNISSIFYGCSNLKFLDLSNFKTDKVTNMSSMFYDCSALTFLNISNFETDEVTDMSCMFYDCSALTFLNISNFKTNKVTNMLKMFNGCSGITSLNLSNFITDNVVTMSGLFYQCSGLTSLDLLNFKTDKVTDMSYMFYDCKELKSLNLSNFKTDKANNIRGMFSSCYKLINLDFKNLNIGSNYVNYMFANCYSLKYIDFSNVIESDKINEYYYADFIYDTPYDLTYCILNPNKAKYLVLALENRTNECYINCDNSCISCEKNDTSLCTKCNSNYYKKEKDLNNDFFNCFNSSPNGYYLYENDSENKYYAECSNNCYSCNGRTENDCLSCDNITYYMLESDYIKRSEENSTSIKSFKCYKKNNNYVIINKNGNYLLKECDSEHYYFINGTCIKNSSYDEADECFYLCINCYTFSKSFLYMQCMQCDEKEYTLDIYSYKQSYCIPKDNSSSYFINKQLKWYITGYDKSENNTNYSMEDFKDNKYKNMNFSLVYKCPNELPYVIHSIRQCVSKCNNYNDKIEYGIFMNMKLYLYNNQCYNNCPKGSIENNETMTCIEIYKYTITNNDSIKNYEENYQDEINKYLGESANNSLAIIKNDDFTNYFYNSSIDEDLKYNNNLPILDIDKCIATCREYYGLSNNDDIFIGLIEYNDLVNKGLYESAVNSTKLTLFTVDGEILDISPCYNQNYTVKKYISPSLTEYGFNTDLWKNYKILILEDNSNKIDYCTPLVFNEKDTTDDNKKCILTNKINLCDDGCKFIEFNYSSNYSICNCIFENEKNINVEENSKKIINFLENNKCNEFAQFKKEGNWKYFNCIKSAFNKEYTKNNVLIYFSGIFFVFGLISFIIYLIKYKTIKEKVNKDVDDEINKIYKKYNKLNKNIGSTTPELISSNEQQNNDNDLIVNLPARNAKRLPKILNNDVQDIEIYKKINNDIIITEKENQNINKENKNPEEAAITNTKSSERNLGLNNNNKHKRGIKNITNNNKENNNDLINNSIIIEDLNEESITKEKNSKSTDNKENNNETLNRSLSSEEENVYKFKNKEIKFENIFKENLKNKMIFISIITKKNILSVNNIWFCLQLLFFLLQMMLFFNAYLYIDYYINKRFVSNETGNSFSYIVKNDLDKSVHTTIIVIVIYKVFTFIFRVKQILKYKVIKNLNDVNQGEINKNVEQLKYSLFIIMFVFTIIMILFHLMSVYFVLVFGNIYKNNQWPLIICFIFSIVFILIYYIIICLLNAIFRFFGTKYSNYLLLSISVWINKLI